LFINQNGVAVKHAYTKDAPNGMPPMVQVTVKGEQIWDDTDRLVFLQNMVDTQIIPKLKAINGEQASGVSEAKPAESLEDFANDMKSKEEDPF
jgi:hypothetical protein